MAETISRDSKLIIRGATREEHLELVQLMAWLADSDDYPNIRDAIRADADVPMSEVRVKITDTNSANGGWGMTLALDKDEEDT
jgi:hypothetical protein